MASAGFSINCREHKLYEQMNLSAAFEEKKDSDVLGILQMRWKCGTYSKNDWKLKRRKTKIASMRCDDVNAEDKKQTGPN